MNGLMGFVADTVEENGDVQGIIPEVLRGIEAKHPQRSEYGDCSNNAREKNSDD